VRHREVGHLFQGRYKAILCDKDEYLLELVRYIHLNPVRAKIAKRPEDYPWTGHLNYLGEGGENLIDEEFVLDQFGKNRDLARGGYRQFVWEGISAGHEERYYQVKDQRYLGEESFVERIELERKETEGWVYDVPLEAIVKEVSRATGIAESRLHSATKDREGVRGRGLTGYLARKMSGYTVKEIADHFRRSPVTIGEGIMRIEEELRRDKSFDNSLRCLEESLVQGRKRKFRVSVA